MIGLGWVVGGNGGVAWEEGGGGGGTSFNPVKDDIKFSNWSPNLSLASVRHWHWKYRYYPTLVNAPLLELLLHQEHRMILLSKAY